jgi:nucleoside 2-deoxyribosyltransferase
MQNSNGHIYLAAPLFTKAEQDFNLTIAEYLRQHRYRVFVPQQECQGKELADIYQTCLLGLRSARTVVAVLDGADADSGTCWECGYAVSQGIPVIGVRTDFRGSGDTRGFNAMLYFSAARIIESGDRYLPEIAIALKELIEN